MLEKVAEIRDVRLVAMMMDTFRQVWAGRLGGGPQNGSPLANDLTAEQRFASLRQPVPLGQAWTYAQTLGQVATNHEEMLREALQRSANGDGTRPVSTVDTLTRVIVELLAKQVWLTNPGLTTGERFARTLALEGDAARAQWRMTHPGEIHMGNPALAAIESDASRLGIALPRVPDNTQLAGELFERACRYVPGMTVTNRTGKLMYRLLSGAVHGDVAHLLGVLLPTGDFDRDKPVFNYSLSAAALWRAAVCVFLAAYAARSTYADWLGIEIPGETERLSLHHIRRATREVNA